MENKKWLEEHNFADYPVYHDTLTVIDNPTVTLLMALRRGLIVPVTEEEEIAGKLAQLAVADKAAD